MSLPIAAPDREGEIRRLLATARTVLKMDVAFASLFEDGDQHFKHVVTREGVTGPGDGFRAALDGSYCVRVLGGELPPLIPDVAAEPTAAGLEITGTLDIGSYVGVPMTGRAGGTIGMLCCTSSDASPHLAEAALPVMNVLAGVVAQLMEEDADDKAQRRARVQPLVDGIGRRHVIQPIVDVRTGVAVGAEALSRFADTSLRPDQWFAEAELVGLGVALEVAAARSGLSGLASWPGYISVNVSPQLVLDGALDELLRGVDPSRVVLEITEHAAVADYGLLHERLSSHRQAGLRLAIDDAGAGYASFRHILELRPDYIKIDLSLTRGIDRDPVRQALVTSLATFAPSAGATLIAEGVETQQELDTLARLGVTLMQGYLFSHPVDAPHAQGYATTGRHVLINAANSLAVMLATELRRTTTLEESAPVLLEALLGLTGLETGFISLLCGDKLEQRYVRNAGSMEITQGAVIPWAGSPCSLLNEQGMCWTADARVQLSDSSFVRATGLQTFLSIPLSAADGSMIGSLCAASREVVHLTDPVLAQAELIARLVSAEFVA